MSFRSFVYLYKNTYERVLWRGRIGRRKLNIETPHYAFIRTFIRSLSLPRKYAKEVKHLQMTLFSSSAMLHVATISWSPTDKEKLSTAAVFALMNAVV